MQRVTVKEVHPSPAENKPTVLILADGAKISGFQASLKELQPGTVLDVDILIKGAYNNIKDYKVIEEAAAPPGRPQPPAAAGPMSSTSIKWFQAAIIAYLWTSGKMPDESVQVQWLKNWLPPGKAESDKSFDDMFGKSGSEPTTVKEVLEYVASHGKEYNLTWFLEQANVDMDSFTLSPVTYYRAINKQMGWGRKE